MKKIKAFSLIEISICLLIMGLMLSVVLPTFRMIQKHLQYQKEESTFQMAEVGLAWYYSINQIFPYPEGMVVKKNGVLMGQWPSKILGNLPLKIEYYVDERIVILSTERFCRITKNRMTMIDSEPMIPFVLKIKERLFYKNNGIFYGLYFPLHLDEKGRQEINPGNIPKFNPPKI